MARGKSSNLREYLRTPGGKVMVTIFVIVLLVFLAAMIALLIIALREGRFLSKPGAPKAKTTVTTESKKPTEPKKQTSEEIAPPPTEPSPMPETFEPYEYRDPFDPLVKPLPAVTTATTTGTTTTTTTATTSSTNGGTMTTTSVPLSLLDILAEGGTRFALINYGSAVYKLKAGERVGRSPYALVSVGTSSATLLYGDDRVVLKIGEQVVRY